MEQYQVSRRWKTIDASCCFLHAPDGSVQVIIRTRRNSLMKHIFRTLAAVVVMLTFIFSLSGALPAAHTASSASYMKHLSAVTPSISSRACPKADPRDLRIFSTVQGNTCFAGDGYMAFRIEHATFLHAGENTGWVKCYGGLCGQGTKLRFLAFNSSVLDDVLITQVNIDVHLTCT
jgi:hypothetical protein